MNKRLVWLAPIALAVLLSGCSVTVTTRGPLAPDTLEETRLVLTNEDSGGPLDTHDSSVNRFPVGPEITYYFLDSNQVRDFDLDVTTSNWSYRRSGNKATVEIVFPYDGRDDLIIECRLTFLDRRSGTHRCEFERKGTRTVAKKTTHFGWGEGEFELEEL